MARPANTRYRGLRLEAANTDNGGNKRGRSGRSSLFPLLRSASFSQSVFQFQASRCLSHESVRSVRQPFFSHLRIALSSFSFCGLFTIAFHVRGRGIGQGERTDSSSLLRVRHKLPYLQSSARSTKLACCQSRTRSQLLHHNP